MLFIGRTMNKETQLCREEKGEERGGGEQYNPKSCAYYLRNLTVSTESVPGKRELRGKCPSGRERTHTPPEWSGAVRPQMLRPVGASGLVLQAGVTAQYSYCGI